MTDVATCNTDAGIVTPIPTLTLPVAPLTPPILPRISALSCCEYAYEPIAVLFTADGESTFELNPIVVFKVPTTIVEDD